MSTNQQRFNELMDARKEYSLALMLGGMSEEETERVESLLNDVELTLEEDFGLKTVDLSKN